MATSSVSFSELEAAAQPAKPAESPVTPTATETAAPAAPATPQFTDQDVQTLRTLSDAGITLTNYQQLLQANTLLEKLPDIIKTNPKVLTAEIAKADPVAYRSLLEAVSDEWWEVIGKHDPKYKTAQGTASSVTPSPDPRIDQIQSQLQSLIQTQNQERSERQNKAMFDGYKSAMDGLLAKVPDTVPETSKDYIRLKTQELISNDAQARDRIFGKGIYVDLPKYFAEASAKATADTKASAEKEHTRRSEIEARGAKTIVPAAEAVNGTQAGPQEDPVWGDTGMLKDLQTALKR